VARRHRFPVARSARRQTTWVASADQEYTSLASNALGIQQSFDPTASGFIKPTIVRTRGLLSVEPQTAAADLSLVGAMGIGIVTDAAFAAGAASLPGPITNQDWDGWFVWMPWAFTFESITQAGVLNFSHEWLLDSKSMRKVSDEETVVVMVESQVSAVRVSVQFRMLLKIA